MTPLTYLFFKSLSKKFFKKLSINLPYEKRTARPCGRWSLRHIGADSAGIA